MFTVPMILNKEKLNIESLGVVQAGSAGSASGFTIDYSSLAPQENDFAVLVVGMGFPSGYGTGFDLTAPSGYTEQAELVTTDSRRTRHYVFTKIIADAEDSVTISSRTGYSDTGCTRQLWLFRNVDTSTPLDAAVATAQSDNSGLANPPSITPTTSGAYILATGSAGIFQSTETFASGDLTTFTTTPGAGNSTSHSVIGSGLKVDWESGAFDPSAFTRNVGPDSSGDSWAAVTIAIRPA